MFSSYHDKKSFPLGLNILGTTICNHQTASRWIVDTDFWNSWSPDKSGKYSFNKWIYLILHVKLQKVKIRKRLHEVTIKKNSHQRWHLMSSLLMLNNECKSQKPVVRYLEKPAYKIYRGHYVDSWKYEISLLDTCSV